jgi:uncharacterized protein (DUF952 family)
MSSDRRPRVVFKILPANEWRQAESAGQFSGSELDRQDGFIHLSAAHQVQTTADRYFAGHNKLVLLTVDADSLGADLRWEVSRGGQLFPHYYGILKRSHVISVQPLRPDQSGRLLVDPSLLEPSSGD